MARTPGHPDQRDNHNHSAEAGSHGVAASVLALACACGSPANDAETSDTGSTAASPETSSPQSTESGADPGGDSEGILGSTGADEGGESTGAQVDDTGDDPSECGDRRPTGPFVANPVLAGLEAGHALDLGSYDCFERIPQMDYHCEKITDFSRLNYDPYLHRVLMFGGGHAATGRTDVDVLSLEDLRWQSMVPSMSCEEVEAADLDPRGFHTATGHPMARHTYDQTVVAEVDGVGQMLMLSAEGAGGFCHPYDAPIESVAALPLDGCTTWSYSPRFQLPWDIATGTEYDPVSGMIIIIGSTRGAGEGGMWVYDPATYEVVTFVDEVAYGEYDSSLVYFPPNDRMYHFEKTGLVWEVELVRNDWSATRATLLDPSGTPPEFGKDYAYDCNAAVIGGGINNGVFHAYDPVANNWSAEPIVSVSDEDAEVTSTRAHVLDYDPINNVYIFIDEGFRTWAYRHRD